MPAHTLNAKVRVNFRGKPYLGEVTLPHGHARVSDLLNDSHPFLYLDSVSGASVIPADSALALNKADINFVQALDEGLPPNPTRIVQGEYIQVAVTMRQPEMHLHGHVFVPDGLGDPGLIVNDDRRFLSLRDVGIADSDEHYDYLAVSKAQCIAITVGLPVCLITGSQVGLKIS